MKELETSKAIKEREKWILFYLNQMSRTRERLHGLLRFTADKISYCFTKSIQLQRFYT